MEEPGGCEKHICKSALVEKLQVTVEETPPWLEDLITQEWTSLESHHGTSPRLRKDAVFIACVEMPFSAAKIYQVLLADGT